MNMMLTGFEDERSTSDWGCRQPA